MASTYSTNLALELPGTGDQSGTWGSTTNTNIGTLLEQAISGYVTQAITDGADTTITIPNGATGVARNMAIEFTGTLTSNRNLIVPANKKLYFVYNNTTGGFTVTIKVSAQAGIPVPNGAKMALYCNGSDVFESVNRLTNLTVTNSIVGSITGSSTSCTGNSATASAVAASALTGTTLASNVVTSSLTSVGTLIGLTVTNPISGSITGNAGSASAVAASGITGTTLAANVIASSLTSVGTLAGLTVTNPITGSITGSSGSCTGNAATATTASAVAASAITGTTLAANVVTSSLTTVGTLVNLTVTNPISGSLSGNATTATTASAVAASAITGATLAAGVTASSLTSVGTLTGLTVGGHASTPPIVVTFSATTMTLDCNLSNVFTTTFTNNVTSAPTLSNAFDGQTINWFITQDATGSRTMTWPTSFKWPGGTAGVLSTAINSVDLLVATYRSATGFWYASLSKAFS